MITDPWFYAAAIPAALLIGLSKSGFASGFGALAVPLLALSVPVPQAAAILLPLLVASDLVGLTALVRQRDQALIRLLLPAGLLGVLVGALLFGVLSAQTVAAVVGALTLAFLAIAAGVPAAGRCAAAAALAGLRARHGLGLHQLRRARRQPAGRPSTCCRCGCRRWCTPARWRCSSPP